jgi:hypothetical protein
MLPKCQQPYNARKRAAKTRASVPLGAGEIEAAIEVTTPEGQKHVSDSVAIPTRKSVRHPRR